MAKHMAPAGYAPAEQEKTRETAPKKKKRGLPAVLPLLPAVLPLLAAVLLAALWVALAGAGTLWGTIGSSGYMQGRVGASGFGKTVRATLETAYGSYAAGSGFAADLLLDAVPVERIEGDMKKSVAGLYGEALYETDYADLRDEIYATLCEEAQRLGVTLTQDVQDALYRVAEYCRKDYARYVGVPMAGRLRGIVQAVAGRLPKLAAVCACACVPFLLLTFLLAGGGRQGLRFWGYSLLAAALVCLVVALAAYPLLGLQRLNLAPPSLKNFLLSIVQGLFGFFGWFAAGYALLGAGCAVAGQMRKKAK